MVKLIKYKLKKNSILRVDETYSLSLIDELYLSSNNKIKNCCTIDVLNDEIRHTDTSVMNRTISFKPLFNAGINLGFVSLNLNTELAQKEASSNLIDKWISHAKKSMHVFIYNINSTYFDLVTSFIEEMINTPNVYITVINNDYKNPTIIEHPNSRKINDEISKEISSNIAKNITTAQAYIFRILGYEKSISDSSFLKYLSSSSKYTTKSVEFFQSSEFFVPFIGDENNASSEVSNDTNIMIEVSKAIDLLKQYDPFNLKIIAHFYKLINFNNLYYEIDTILNQNIQNYKSIAQTEELKCELLLLKTKNIYNSHESSHNDYVLELKKLYNYFNYAYNNNENYVVITLDLLLFAQLNNISEIDLSREVYIKLNERIDRIEGVKSIRTLEATKFTLSYLSTAIQSPMAIIKSYPEYYNLENIEDVLVQNKDSQRVLYAYSNILGSLVVHHLSNKTNFNIYKTFVKLILSHSIILPIKVINNLAIYEMYSGIEPHFIIKLKEYVDNKLKEQVYDSRVIIAINNLLYHYPNDDLFKIYKEHYDKNDEFYSFYFKHAADYYNKRSNYTNERDLTMYNDLDLKVIIKGQLELRDQGIFDKESYLFIDNQFWGLERE